MESSKEGPLELHEDKKRPHQAESLPPAPAGNGVNPAVDGFEQRQRRRPSCRIVNRINGNKVATPKSQKTDRHGDSPPLSRKLEVGVGANLRLLFTPLALP